MKIFELIKEQGPQGTVKPVASAVVKSPSKDDTVGEKDQGPASSDYQIQGNLKQAQKEYDDIEKEKKQGLATPQATPKKPPKLPIGVSDSIPWGPKHPHWPGSA